MNDAPILAITMGDPAGIGPEIVAHALHRPGVRAACRPVVVGDPAVMRRAVGFAGVPLSVHAITAVAEAGFAADVIDVLAIPGAGRFEVPVGVVSAAAGDAAFLSVRTAIELALRGEVDGTVTAPIHKEALSLAGHKFPGHTEIYAHFTGTRDFTMMLVAGDLRVVHVSTHVSLRQACDAVTKDRVLSVIRLAHTACQQLGIDAPRIGVAGLNPHASDGGLFGSEERDHIAPAIAAAQAAGIRADGPYPPDTFYAKAVSGFYDCVVAMYHDQGHIPVKVIGFHFDRATASWDRVNGINVSLGMPIIRTSVDHGTAFDQAGKGTASDESLLDAIGYAARLAAHRTPA